MYASINYVHTILYTQTSTQRHRCFFLLCYNHKPYQRNQAKFSHSLKLNSHSLVTLLHLQHFLLENILQQTKMYKLKIKTRFSTFFYYLSNSENEKKTSTTHSHSTEQATSPKPTAIYIYKAFLSYFLQLAFSPRCFWILLWWFTKLFQDYLFTTSSVCVLSALLTFSLLWCGSRIYKEKKFPYIWLHFSLWAARLVYTFFYKVVLKAQQFLLPNTTLALHSSVLCSYC